MLAKENTIALEQFFDRFVAFENRVALRFDQVEQGFKAELARWEVRVWAVETTIEKLNGNLDALTREYHAITGGLNRLKAKIDELGKGMKSVRSDVDSLRRRMSVVEKWLNKIGRASCRERVYVLV